VIDWDGCGGPSLVTPSVWWSPHGQWWARIPLGGPRPRDGLEISVTRVSDRLVFADVLAGPRDEQVWMSTTGRRWSRVPSSRWLGGTLATDGQHAVSVCYPTRKQRRLRIAAIGPGLSRSFLRASGAGPMFEKGMDEWQSAVGPTGVLVLDVHGRLWLAAPMAG
jgi:hypothetical protein